MPPQLLQLDEFILSIRLKAALVVQPVVRATAITHRTETPPARLRARLVWLDENINKQERLISFVKEIATKMNHL